MRKEMTIDDAISEIERHRDEALEGVALTPEDQEERKNYLNEAIDDLNKIKNASTKKNNLIISDDELIKFINSLDYDNNRALEIRDKVKELRRRINNAISSKNEDKRSKNDGDKTSNNGKNKRKAISISIGTIVSILLLALGLALAFLWFENEKDTVYFVVEGIKDILGGIGAGTFTNKYISKKENRPINKSVSILSFVLLGISFLGVIIFVVFAFFPLFNRVTYIYLEVGFILLSFIGLCCVIFNNSEKNVNSDNNITGK